MQKKDEFAFLEDKIYERYPSYKEGENYFLCNGIKINRFKTMEENKINNGAFITLNALDEEDEDTDKDENSYKSENTFNDGKTYKDEKTNNDEKI